MSLTKAQKELLDSIVEDRIKVLYQSKSIFKLRDFKDLLERASLPYNGNSVFRSIQRINAKLGYKDLYAVGVGNSTAEYSYQPALWINNRTDIRKEKNILHFLCCDDENLDITYDFLTQKFSIDLTNRCSWRCHDWAEPYIIRYYSDICVALKYEWLWNYTDNLREIIDIIHYCDKEEYCTMPKDLLRIKGEESLNVNHIKQARYSEKYGFKYSRFILEMNDTGNYSNNVKKFLESAIDMPTLMKMVVNNIYTGRTRGVYRDIYNLVETYYTAIVDYNIPTESIIFDTNRDIETNRLNIASLIDSVKNKTLSERLQKLNFINNLTIDDYIIIVPQAQADKIDEGKQQNNCVGYYYDESISRGENLIYFLRHKDNPKKSYITCRFNLISRNTAEYRRKNNESVYLSKDVEVIKKIDNLIKAELFK